MMKLFVLPFTAAQGFELYDLTHLSWLTAFLLAGFAICVLYRRLDGRGKRVFEICTGCAILALEAAKYIWLICHDKQLVYYLPLHLCSFAIYIEFLDSLTGSRFLHELTYSICFPAALAALCVPGWTGEPVGSFLHIHSFVIHFLLVLYPLLLLTGKRFTPSVRLLPLCFVFTALLAVPVYFIDRLLEQNYMFLITPPPGSPLVFFERLWGNPGYLFGYPIIAAAVWILLYMPVIAGNRMKHRQQV